MQPHLRIGLRLLTALAFLIAVGAAWHTADFQDYGAAYLPGWELVLAGQSPWADRAADYSYGPAYNLLAPLLLLHLLAPKLLFVVAWFVLTIVVVRHFGRRAKDESAAWLWGGGVLLLSPIAWIEVPYFGHADVLLALASTGALILAQRGHAVPASALLALGALVKFYPAVLLPALVLQHRSVKWRALLAFVLVFAGGMALAWAIWGASVFEPLAFATERHSKHLSIFRALRGSFSPTGDLDQYAPVVTAVGLIAMSVYGIWRKLETVRFGFCLLLVLLTLYPAGHVQYLFVLSTFVPLLELERRHRGWKSHQLHLALVLYFGWITAYHMGYYFAARFREPPWEVMRELGGFVTFPLACGLLIVLLRAHAEPGDQPADHQRSAAARR